MYTVETLRKAIQNNDPWTVEFPRPNETFGLEYAVWRLLNAWRDDPKAGPDLAVLLRQVIRWGHGNIFLGSLPHWLNGHLESTNLSLTPSGFLQAEPFSPAWLNGEVHPDEGIDSRPEFRRLDERIIGEPYLSSLRLSSAEDQLWNSRAQKEAAWAVLTAPPRSTTLIALPTGSGKSLCFQLLARFGSGLTVVIVPTIALALDHKENTAKIFSELPGINPIYFASSDPDINPDAVRDSIKSGTTRLIFTSPEACVEGRLRKVLEEAAGQGRLENLVIDEAHIIESWGIYFRVDFQMLSTLRSKWMEHADSTLRTYLLSATFTQNCRHVLQDLYGGGGEWREFISQRLRPEIKYYQHLFETEDDRLCALAECAWNLPRPAIFYTTEVDEAKQLAYYLRESLGFSRIGCFHGETKGSERRALLQKWRRDKLDIMVATSAFGLGVDKPDVRSVVHACLPENLHRFYQEVGRGGRDGASCNSILIPCSRDIEVAEGLTPKLLGEEKIQKRWEGLYHESEVVSLEDHEWKLRTDSRHMGLLGTRTWGENVRWNKRLILQLKRAGLLDIQDLEYRNSEEGEEPSEWVKVKLKFNPTLHNLGEKLSHQRSVEISEIHAGLDQMKEFLREKKCAGRYLRELYGPETLPVCGGCSFCRRQKRLPGPCPSLNVPLSAEKNPNVSVVLGVPDPLRSDQNKAEFKKLIRRCVGEKSIRRFLCEIDRFEYLMDLFRNAVGPASSHLYRIDPFDADLPLHIDVNDILCYFHLNRLDHRVSEIRSGQKIIHLVCDGLTCVDCHGRYFLESRGAVVGFYEYWLKEA